MLSLHQLWLLLAVDAGVAIAGTLVVARYVGFPRGGAVPSGVATGAGGSAASAPGRADGPSAGGGAAGGGDETANAEGTWHEEAVDLAREVGRTVASFDPPTDADRVSRRLLPLSARLRGHARSAPPAADADVHRGLFELGVACQRVAIEGRPEDGPRGHGRLRDRLDALGSEAIDLRERAEAVA